MAAQIGRLRADPRGEDRLCPRLAVAEAPGHRRRARDRLLQLARHAHDCTSSMPETPTGYRPMAWWYRRSNAWDRWYARRHCRGLLNVRAVWLAKVRTASWGVGRRPAFACRARL